MSHGLTEGCHTHRAHKFTCRFFQSHRLFAKVRVNTSPEDWYPLRAHAQFHQVFLVLGYLCNPLRIILWYTSGYFPCYAIPKRRRPRWRHFAVLLTSEAHKRSEQTRSSSYLHTNSPDTCTVKNACGFTACYPEKKQKKRSGYIPGPLFFVVFAWDGGGGICACAKWLRAALLLRYGYISHCTPASSFVSLAARMGMEGKILVFCFAVSLVSAQRYQIIIIELVRSLSF